MTQEEEVLNASNYFGHVNNENGSNEEHCVKSAQIQTRKNSVFGHFSHGGKYKWKKYQTNEGTEN